MNRSRSGFMALSWVDTTYHDGMVFHAAVFAGSPKIAAASGFWVAANNSASSSGRSFANAPWTRRVYVFALSWFFMFLFFLGWVIEIEKDLAAGLGVFDCIFDFERLVCCVGWQIQLAGRDNFRCLSQGRLNFGKILFVIHP